MSDYDPRDPEDAYLRGKEQGYRQGYADGYRDGLEIQRAQAVKPRKVGWSLSDYERVAAVYQKAFDECMTVQASVAQAMGVTPAQAGALIHATRKLGLLPQTTRGRKKAR
jgi:flagellar biosynthesis/type III secretory pathway protein FliH